MRLNKVSARRQLGPWKLRSSLFESPATLPYCDRFLADNAYTTPFFALVLSEYMKPQVASCVRDRLWGFHIGGNVSQRETIVRYGCDASGGDGEAVRWVDALDGDGEVGRLDVGDASDKGSNLFEFAPAAMLFPVLSTRCITKYN
jgi:hypothetical protein